MSWTLDSPSGVPTPQRDDELTSEQVLAVLVLVGHPRDSNEAGPCDSE